MEERKVQHGHPHGVAPEEDELISDREGGAGGDAGSDDFESEGGIGGRAESTGAQPQLQLQRNPGDLKGGPSSEGPHHRRPSLHEEHYRLAGPSSKHHHPLHDPRHHHSPSQPHHGHHTPHHTQQHRPRPSPYGQPSSSAASSSHRGHRYSTSVGSMSQAISSSYRSSGDHRSKPYPQGVHRPPGQRLQWDNDLELDADGEADAEGDYLDEEHGSTPPPRSATGTSTRRVKRRPWPVGLADLDSPSGRYVFLFF